MCYKVLPPYKAWLRSYRRQMKSQHAYTRRGTQRADGNKKYQPFSEQGTAKIRRGHLQTHLSGPQSQPPSLARSSPRPFATDPTNRQFSPFLGPGAASLIQKVGFRTVREGPVDMLGLCPLQFTKTPVFIAPRRRPVASLPLRRNRQVNKGVILIFLKEGEGTRRESLDEPELRRGDVGARARSRLPNYEDSSSWRKKSQGCQLEVVNTEGVKGQWAR
ncbi:hypothetical protein CVT26_000656 [Gymnopilus dilepis]|uniref:Uncharacterized protein n=1 Tax=Gymnopilus dilepis TaxID=231916 RepID=A0A409Y2J9_9AGAR|nr:hypothetical protein CVT26_000656 [Gymnopilus dilepis]